MKEKSLLNVQNGNVSINMFVIQIASINYLLIIDIINIFNYLTSLIYDTEFSVASVAPENSGS